jgi:hypothetical protein
MKMKNEMEQIKKSLLYYGSSYRWVRNDIAGLTQEAIELLKEKNVPFNEHNLDHAAYCIINRRF